LGDREEESMNPPSVTCVCLTRGRFKFLREALQCFLDQDYSDAKLLIFNNHPVPITCDCPNVQVVNETGFSSLGEIYEKAYSLTTSEYIHDWADDDLYMPFAVSAAVVGIYGSKMLAFKPIRSWVSLKQKDYSLSGNWFEASHIYDGDFLRAERLDKSTPACFIKTLSRLQAEGRHLSGLALPYYVFQWDIPVFHISGLMGTVSQEENLRRFNEREQDTGGGLPLEPSSVDHHWKRLMEFAPRFLPANDVESLRVRLGNHLR